MKKRFYFSLLVLALVLLAIPGLAAQAAKRAARPFCALPKPADVAARDFHRDVRLPTIARAAD